MSFASRPVASRFTMALVIAAGLGVAEAQAAPFQNGGFESPSVGSGFQTVTGNAIPGWTIDGTVDLIGTHWPPAEGNQSIDLNGFQSLASIRQTFDTIIGATYFVSFAMNGNPDGPPPIKTMVAEIDGVNGDDLFTQSFSYVMNLQNRAWIEYGFSFVADGISATLSFTSTTSDPNHGFGQSYGPALDDVRVSTVPEPATLAMLALGLAGLGSLRRRRG